MNHSLRIDYVSPLPPTRSGIADYSADLLPHLAQICDVRVVRVPGQEVDESLAQHYEMIQVDRLGEDGRLPLYQMGNNQHHLEIHTAALRTPGVLTLHDLVLHHFLIEQTLAREDFAAYREQLATDHGWIGDAAARPMQRPGADGMAARFALPAHRTLLRSQRGIITHSPWAAEYLHEEDPDLAVRAVTMGIPLPAAADDAVGRDFRQRYNLPTQAPMLGSFGFQTPIKRTSAVIRALARPELEGVHLMVAGEVSASCQLEELAAELGVSERVRVLGFLPYEDFEAGIAAADLCVNLRYPTAGETSASLLRILAVGRPVIISDHAQSSDLPDDVAVKTPLGEGEEEILARRLAELLKDDEALQRMSERARRYVAEEHTPQASARAIADACQELGEREPPTARPPQIQPPTSFVGHGFQGEIVVDGIDTWPAGSRRRLQVHLHNHGPAKLLAAERPGGIALEVRLLAGGRDLCNGKDWIPLPFDLAPGDEYVFEVTLRRPPGAARLEIVPHALGRQALSALGGPSFAQELPSS